MTDFQTGIIDHWECRVLPVVPARSAYRYEVGFERTMAPGTGRTTTGVSQSCITLTRKAICRWQSSDGNDEGSENGETVRCELFWM